MGRSQVARNQRLGRPGSRGGGRGRGGGRVGTTSKRSTEKKLKTLGDNSWRYNSTTTDNDTLTDDDDDDDEGEPIPRYSSGPSHYANDLTDFESHRLHDATLSDSRTLTIDLKALSSALRTLPPSGRLDLRFGNATILGQMLDDRVGFSTGVSCQEKETSEKDTRKSEPNKMVRTTTQKAEEMTIEQGKEEPFNLAKVESGNQDNDEEDEDEDEEDLDAWLDSVIS